VSSRRQGWKEGRKKKRRVGSIADFELAQEAERSRGNPPKAPDAPVELAKQEASLERSGGVSLDEEGRGLMNEFCRRIL
jgi:hypothetical protein